MIFPNMKQKMKNIERKLNIYIFLKGNKITLIDIFLLFKPICVWFVKNPRHVDLWISLHVHIINSIM